MRMCLAICLITLLCIAPSALAQDNLLPPCSDARLGTLAEIQPTYDALIEAGQIILSRADFRSYIESYFAWREDLWAQMSHCAEVFEIALLMNQIASNQVGRAALDRALQVEGLSTKANPYVFEEYGEGNLPDQLTARIEAIEVHLNDAERGSTVESDFRSCADADIDIFYAEVFDPYFALIETFQQSTSVSDLLTLIDSLLEWRKAVWLGLPACVGMAEITWHITNSASDMAVLLAFYLADMKPEFDLYNAESSRTSATIAELTPAFVGSSTSDLMLPESTLRSCTQSELNEAVDIIAEYAELVEAANAVSSIADAFAFSERQYQWREMRLAALPRCAEVFELGLLIDQSTGDAVVTMALLLAR